jgi:hypothetical protein
MMDEHPRVTEWAGIYPEHSINPDYMLELKPWYLRSGLHVDGVDKQKSKKYTAVTPEWNYFPFRTPCEYVADNINRTTNHRIWK